MHVMYIIFIHNGSLKDDWCVIEIIQISQLSKNVFINSYYKESLIYVLKY